MIHEHLLGGCAPTPLAHYLKALGILRLVSEQKDPHAAGRWQGEQFVLRTVMSRAELERFFLEEYRPSPIISPWNGRAGFLEGEDADNSTRKGAVIVNRFLKSKGNRFAAYRLVISRVSDSSIVQALNSARVKVKRGGKVDTKKLKTDLLVALRGELPDEFVEWIDACLVVTDKPIPAPILGTGGNEGSMDLSVNHLMLLDALFALDTDDPTVLARTSLGNAFWGEVGQLSRGVNSGQLAPGYVGGANMGCGFDGALLDNPWNPVLMLEGSVLFTAVTTKLLEHSTQPTLSFPFVVEAGRSGHGGISSSESVRPELWLPIWSRWMSFVETRTFFSEGRSTIGKRRKRRVQNATDFARAVASLATDRGIDAFSRVGFFERRGQGYYVATPVGRFSVPKERGLQVDLLCDIDGWLENLSGFSRGKNATGRIQQLLRRLEDGIFALTQGGGHPALQNILILIGQIQQTCADSAKAREAILPVPLLGAEWAMEADDNSHEFRLACALAGLTEIRGNLLPIKVNKGKIEWDAGSSRAVWGGGNLVVNLLRVLDRRLLDAQRGDQADKPLTGLPAADLAAVLAFLQGETDDERISGLLAGLVNVKLPQHLPRRELPVDQPPAAFGLLKPLFTPDTILQKLDLLPSGGHLPLPREVVTLLKTGNREQVNRAIDIAWRRLRIAGLKLPSHPRQPIDFVGLDSARLAAALMISLAMADLARICQPFTPIQKAD
ncbi:MAG: type I-U CRISPR-associated protein Csx17 [Methylothermaceae bacterium]|nr:type I-U CRISPR-associated protein Csx17 [Methylothermaceae bacterium]